MTVTMHEREHTGDFPVICPPSGAGRWKMLVREPAAWYVAFALYAGAVALFSGLGQDHWWGIWGFGGYGVAAVVAACWRSKAGRIAAIGVSLAGALAGPSTWLVTYRPTTPDAAVVMRSGSLLLHHGSPYLSSAALAHGGWLAYNPYLPVMALFGVPKAVGLPGMLGDPRLWLALVTFCLLYAAFRIMAPQASASRRAAFMLASPVLAFPLSMSITDPPVIALTCLAVALAVRRSALSAALVIAVACAMKETAWPAAAVLAALMGARYGGRAAARFAVAVATSTVALVVICAPAAVRHVSDLVENTVAYPLGLTKATSPAQSPLPGHLLTSLGHGGHVAAVALLVISMVSIAISLLVRPPATAKAAVIRLSLTLSLLFALCPATRWGYFGYPGALCGWLALAAVPRRAVDESSTAFQVADRRQHPPVVPLGGS
jgi:hypothetical protein